MIYGTEDLDTVMGIHESMSEHLTYRQYKYDRNRTQSERMSFEYEEDILDVLKNEEYEYMLDALDELGINAEEISIEQYSD